MAIESSLCAQLKASVPVTAAVAGRIYPAIVPTDSTLFPCITYQKVSEVRQPTLQSQNELKQVRIQINAWGRDYPTAKSVESAVRNALDGFAGTLGGGDTVSGCFLDSVTDLIEPSPLAATGRLYGVRMDFLIWVTESAPTLN